MIKKSILNKAVALVLTAGIIFTGCGKSGQDATEGSTAQGTSQEEVTTEASTEAEPALQERVCPADAEHVKIIGHAAYEKDSLWLVTSASGAEFTFRGTKAEITFNGDSTAVKVGGDKNSQARVAIYVNGERVADEMIDDLTKTITAFESDNEEEVTIKVVKLSEAANSTTGIKEIKVTSYEDIKPTEEKELYFRFIGDSITCGYGVDDEDKDHHFSTITEDATKTYAYLTAENLNADCDLFSFSGFGILSGYTSDSNTINETSTVPQYYDKLGFTYGASYKGMKPVDYDWSFEREPDVIVINLGTNDASYTKGDAEKISSYEELYVDFLKKVRGHDKNSKIVCVLGLMGSDLMGAVENAVQAYSEETGDSNVYTMEFDARKSDEGLAADWHPTYASHKRGAEKLTAYIQELLAK
jgi:lysophospholipase L1-like esterase